MKFQFKIQPIQTEAVESVVNNYGDLLNIVMGKGLDAK